jgi:hypothetical protein
MEQWWDDTDKRKLKDSKTSPSQYHFAPRKFHIDCPESKL